MPQCQGCLEGMAITVDNFGKKFHYDSRADKTFACQSGEPLPKGLPLDLPKSNATPKDYTKQVLHWDGPKIDHGVPPMLKIQVPSHQRFNKIIEETIASIRKLSVEKGGEYAGDNDRLANFRRNASEAGTTMELVWRIYAAKHWDAVMQYEKDLRTGKTRPRSEPITGRIDDLIVYLLLLKLMVEERG